MSTQIKTKCKLCRREGQKLFIKGDRCNSPKCAMVKRNFPPGIHGVKGYSRLTDYGVQLREKQKAKRIYRLAEKQFNNYFVKASKSKTNTEEILLKLLEMRFDNIVYRSGIVNSRNIARQLVNHNHFTVNDKKVNIPSFQLKIGDIIKIKNSSKQLKIFNNIKETLKKTEPVAWLSVDPDKFEIKITDTPKIDETKGEFDPKLIIEFYSR